MIYNITALIRSIHLLGFKSGWHHFWFIKLLVRSCEGNPRKLYDIASSLDKAADEAEKLIVEDENFTNIARYYRCLAEGFRRGYKVIIQSE